MEAEKDKALWKIAKKRVTFRRHFFTYLIVNGFLWTLWYYNGTGTSMYEGLPWPAWVTLSWGIGVAFNYYDAFHGNHDQAIEREYEKLSSKKKQ